MSLTALRISQDQVKATKSYQGLSKIQKMLVIKRQNVLQIQNAINVISNIGYVKWHQQSNYSHNNVLIIDELLDNKFQSI